MSHALTPADARAARLGGAVLLVVAAAVGFAIFFADRVHIGASVRIEVYFGHVGPLQEGASVMVAGRRIGAVDAIALVPAAGLPADHPLAGTGGAVAYLRIDQARRDMAPVNGEYFISSRGALGERYLEIGPPRAGAAYARARSPTAIACGASIRRRSIARCRTPTRTSSTPARSRATSGPRPAR